MSLITTPKKSTHDRTIFQFYRSLFSWMYYILRIIILLVNSISTIRRYDIRRTYTKECIELWSWNYNLLRDWPARGRHDHIIVISGGFSWTSATVITNENIYLNYAVGHNNIWKLMMKLDVHHFFFHFCLMLIIPKQETHK